MKSSGITRIILRSVIFTAMTVFFVHLYEKSTDYFDIYGYEIQMALVNEDKMIDDIKVEERNGKKEIKYVYGTDNARRKIAEIKKKKEKEDQLPAVVARKYLLGNFSQRMIAVFILYMMCFLILYKWKEKVVKKVFVLLAGGLVWITVYTLLMILLMYRVKVASMGELITNRFFISIVVLASSLLNYYITKDHERVLENEKLRSLYLSTQFEALKSKLDPHFLFNALNTLSGLIAIKSDKTKEYLQKLSSIFRNVLTHEDVTTLREELNFASAYGDLMTIRYEQSLKINYEMPEKMMERKVVSFGIQSLLENAIKHNTITNRLPMEITVKAEGDYVTVSNPIHPRREREQSSGLGLKMLSERCLALMGKETVIETRDNHFIVKIPTA